MKLNGEIVWWPTTLWLEGILYPICDWLEFDLLALGAIVLTLPISMAAILFQVFWWLLLILFAVITFPFLLLWRITHGR